MKGIPLYIGLLVNTIQLIEINFICLNAFFSLSLVWILVCGEVEALRALLAADADITKTDLNGGSPVC